MKVIRIFIILVLLVSKTSYAENLKIEESIDEECQIFNVCSICDIKGSFNQSIIAFVRKYGDDEIVKNTLLKKIKGAESAIDGEFYDKYGAYYFIKITGMGYKQEAYIKKHLVNKGVHPYDKINQLGFIAIQTVLFDDKIGFDIFEKSGKFLDCTSKLRDLLRLAEFMEKSYFVERILKILNSNKEK